MKNFLCSVLLGVLSVLLLAGGCAEMAVEADKPVSLLEDMGQPAMTFSFAGHQGRIFKLPDPPPNRDFVGTGGLAVFVHGAIYQPGEEYRPPSGSGGYDGNYVGIYQYSKHEKRDEYLRRREIGESKGRSDNLTVCKDYVLFERKDGMLGLYDGKKSYRGSVPWKVKYNRMVGAPNGELLMVQAPDTICLAKLEGTSIGETQVILSEARKSLEEPTALLRPIHLEGDNLFVSLSLGDNHPQMLCLFNRTGELRTCYLGKLGKAADWAVTKHYVLQVGREGDLLIFDRATGKRIFNEPLNGFRALHIYPLDGDRVLLCGGCSTYGVLALDD